MSNTFEMLNQLYEIWQCCFKTLPFNGLKKNMAVTVIRTFFGEK